MGSSPSGCCWVQSDVTWADEENCPPGARHLCLSGCRECSANGYPRIIPKSQRSVTGHNGRDLGRDTGRCGRDTGQGIRDNETQECRNAGMRECRNAGMRMRECRTGMRECMKAGRQKCRKTGEG